MMNGMQCIAHSPFLKHRFRVVLSFFFLGVSWFGVVIRSLIVTRYICLARQIKLIFVHFISLRPERTIFPYLLTQLPWIAYSKCSTLVHVIARFVLNVFVQRIKSTSEISVHESEC